MFDTQKGHLGEIIFLSVILGLFSLCVSVHHSCSLSDKTDPSGYRKLQMIYLAC